MHRRRRGLIQTSSPRTTPVRDTDRPLTVQRPIGLSAAITPWIFPSGMILRKAESTLTAARD
jgi:acyl-CoA reductase-like NAD-dependent aldehyde dehydrogenase